MLREILVD